MAIVANAGCTIAYETRGEGPPLVMVYGVGGNSRRWWEEFPARLARRYRLVMLDNRGTGRSDKPTHPWSMSDMTGDVLAVVDDLGIERFHLLGCSLGSVVARHLVRERGGERLLSLSLLCPPNGIAATEEDRRAALLWDGSRPLVESARNSWPVVHPEAWIAAHEEALLCDFESTMAEPTPGRTFKFQLEAAGAAPDPNSALNNYDWPVLILHGDADRLVPPANARTLAEAVPRARLELLAGDSHNFWQHDPERAAALVLDFLEGAERARGAA